MVYTEFNSMLKYNNPRIIRLTLQKGKSSPAAGISVEFAVRNSDAMITANKRNEQLVLALTV